MQYRFPQFPATSLGSIVTNASPEALTLIGDLLKYDPQQRPTCSQILQYPYYQSCNKAPEKPVEPPRAALPNIAPHAPSGPQQSSYSRKPMEYANTDPRLEEIKRAREAEKRIENADKVEVPDINPLHDIADPSRTNTTYVAKRLANEPRQGPPSNVQLPAPSAATNTSKFSSVIGLEDKDSNTSGKQKDQMSKPKEISPEKKLFMSPDKSNADEGLPLKNSYKPQGALQSQNNSGFSGMMSNFGSQNNGFNTGGADSGNSYLSKPVSSFKPSLMGGNKAPLAPVSGASNPPGMGGFGSGNNLSGSNGFGSNSGYGSGSFGGANNVLGPLNNSSGFSGSGSNPQEKSRFGRLAQFGMGITGNSNNAGNLPSLSGGGNAGGGYSGSMGINNYQPTTSVSAPMPSANAFGGRHKF